MDTQEIQDRLSSLISQKILCKELPEEDEQFLEEWLHESESHRQLFERIDSLTAVREMMRLEAAHYGEAAASEFRKRRLAERHRLIRLRGKRWIGRAAAIAVAATGIWWMTQTAEPLQQATNLPEQQILPGQGKAVLTLGGERRLDIRQTESEEGEEYIFTDAGGHRILPEQLRASTKAEEWHTLTVPAGGEFVYTLEDGTKVWLNSASELRFPAVFSEKERKIYLRGEAFFNVVHDSQRSFVVGLQGGEITVYGTRFCVSHYENSPLSAVLTHGSIGFTTASGKSTRLTPADRLVYEAENDRMRVEKVDTTLYTAWVHKMFIFKGQPLEEIMTTLSRWYDMNVTFLSEDIKNIRLSGRLNRYQDVRILLETYEETADIRFCIEGKNIVISKK